MKTKQFFGTLVGILLAITLITACSKDNYKDEKKDNNNGSNSSTIYMKNSVFSPASLRVKTGTTVKWNNDDTMAHTVTANDNSFDSGEIQPGGNFSRMYNTVGTYPYHCTLHPGMTGTIEVVDDY
ncbi:cupredoxin domain-containing protein [Flavihumibacter solisilvae]|nr:cupredoxin domain-containing protein [Flavihumibacter solisilvae]